MVRSDTDGRVLRFISAVAIALVTGKGAFAAMIFARHSFDLVGLTSAGNRIRGQAVWLGTAAAVICLSLVAGRIARRVPPAIVFVTAVASTIGGGYFAQTQPGAAILLSGFSLLIAAGTIITLKGMATASILRKLVGLFTFAFGAALVYFVTWAYAFFE